MMKKLTQWPHFAKTVLFASIGFYAALTFYQMNRWSIWFDEAFSAYLTRYNFADLAHYTALDVHPPLYYWILKVWVTFLGTSDVAFRSLSLVFGIAVIVLAYKLLQKLFDSRMAALGAFFLAISPTLIHFGQEARMYTMVAAIVLAATYIFLTAQETNQRRYWVAYGLLIAVGMWTHYFTALAWLAHWIIRFVWVHRYKAKTTLRSFFSKEWILVHIGAVALFLPWMPSMIRQLGGIQKFGFWIGPVTADSITNFFTNTLLFRWHDHTDGWFAVLFYVVMGLAGYLLYRAYHYLRSDGRQHLTYIVLSAFAPLVILILGSMPPLRSSYIERYIVPASIFATLLLAIVARYGTIGMRPIRRRAIGLLFVVTLLLGTAYAHTIGNFNKSTYMSIDTKQLAIIVKEKGKPHEPIIVPSPWTYYELSFYETSEHPVYYTKESADGPYGSLAMLQAPNPHKIDNLDAFLKNYDTIWVANYAYDNQVSALQPSWHELQRINVYDNQLGMMRYQAVQYRVH